MAGFLWLAYSVGDLYAAGLIKGGLDLVPLALLLIIGVCVGPGASLAVAWWWRETKLSVDNQGKEGRLDVPICSASPVSALHHIVLDKYQLVSVFAKH